VRNEGNLKLTAGEIPIIPVAVGVLLSLTFRAVIALPGI